jgi:hypothetical protein
MSPLQLLAAAPATDGGGEASPIALVLVLVLLVALIFLIRSMNKHLRKVPPTFDPPGTDAETGEGSGNPEEGAPGPDTSGSTAATADRPSSGSASNSTPKS